jgi:hypothetical protein
MTSGGIAAVVNRDCYDVEKNADFALKIFNAYYHAHNHTGKLYEDFPDFFMAKPTIFEGKDIATRSSDRMLLEDCIQRAKARNGYISVTKHRNPKLGYYWMELSVAPFMLGDAVTKENKGEFFYILTRFIEYTRQNPRIYGDLTAEIDSDKDLALMLDEISQMADRLKTTLKLYPEPMLVAYNQAWPVTEVKKLLESLKDNDQDWCEVFFEYLIYVMGKKTRAV